MENRRTHQSLEGSLALHSKAWAVQTLCDDSPAQGRPMGGDRGGEVLEAPCRCIAVQLQVFHCGSERGLQACMEVMRLRLCRHVRSCRRTYHTAVFTRVEHGNVVIYVVTRMQNHAAAQ